MTRTSTGTIGNLVGMAFAAGAALGCGHEAPPPTASPAREPRAVVTLDPAATKGVPDVGAAWLSYTVVVSAAKMASQASDLAIEVAGRSALAGFWKERRTAGQRDPYLDLLVDVSAAGFMAEYAVAFLARPGWMVPGAELARLNLDGFRRWMPGHLTAQHRPQMLATVTAVGAAPTIPGEGLPADGDIDPRRVPCTSLQPAIAAALRRWDDEEARLGHVALSVMSAEQLLPSFVQAARDPRARRDGVVLVSPRVGNTAFVAGFCAVDGGALADAERLLRKAVALAPGNANVRGELVQTLMMEKKLDDADAQLDVALDLAVSACHTAVLWRKRGYILFDRGKLVESYRAYARSLEFEAGNALALREMQLIVQTLRAAGGFDEKALGSFTPPPPGKLTVTNCR